MILIQQTHNKIQFFKKTSLALLILTFISCGQKNSNNQQTQRTMNVDGYLVEHETFSMSIQSTGDLLPYEEVELKTPVSGNVVNINFKEGQFVEKGFLLVEIDNRSWHAQKRGLEARLKTAERELERKKELLKISGVSLADFEQSVGEVDELRAKINEFEVMIDLSQIRAPFSGRLGMRDFSLGAFLSQGQTITKLVKSDKLKVNFTIASRYSSMVKLNDEVKVILSGTGDTLRAIIYAIDPMISQASRTIQLRAMIDNKTFSLIPGDFVQIILKPEQNEAAILVPAESIIPEQNTQVLYIVKNGLTKKIQVKTANRTSNRVQITEGLHAGDTVITTGLMGIREGEKVVIKTLKKGEE